MPSVVTQWTGTCPERQKQDELSRYLKVLAEINHEYWADHPAPIADINRAMHRAAGIDPLEGPTWREFDIPVEGRTVVSGEVIRSGFGDARESSAAVAERLRASGLPVSTTGEPHARFQASLERCRLRGVDMIVFDPRRLYPRDDRLSLVFLSETGYPLLEGRLVVVHEWGIFAGSSRCNPDEIACQLDAPSLRLRYMHEAWLDCLMAWVKWQFVDNLCYWRNEEWLDARLYNEWFAEAAETQGECDARDAVFSKLCDEFIVECDTWIDRAERNFQSHEAP